MLKQKVDELTQKIQSLASETDERLSEMESLKVMLENTRSSLSEEKVLFCCVLYFSIVNPGLAGACGCSRASK